MWGGEKKPFNNFNKQSWISLRNSIQNTVHVFYKQVQYFVLSFSQICVHAVSHGTFVKPVLLFIQHISQWMFCSMFGGFWWWKGQEWPQSAKHWMWSITRSAHAERAPLPKQLEKPVVPMLLHTHVMYRLCPISNGSEYVEGKQKKHSWCTIQAE